MNSKHTYLLLTLLLSAGLVNAQLVDCWAPANWTVLAPNSTGTGTVTSTSIVIVNDMDFMGSGLDFLDCAEDQGTETVCIEVPESGTLTFDWSIAGAPFFYNPLIDRFGYCINGVPNELSSASPPPFGTSSGTESVSVTAGDDFCFIYSSKFSDVFADISVTISNISTPGCPAACSSASAPSNPTSTVNAPTDVVLSWDAIPGSVACEVNGGPVGGPSRPLRIFGTEISSTTVPAAALTSGTTYEWSVRCACSVDLGPPLSVDATPSSGTSSFLWPAPRMEAGGPIVFPNPASDYVQLNITGEGNYRIQIVSQTGQTVRQLAVNTPGNVLIDVADLPAGVYWIQLADDREVRAEKLIIN